MERLIAYTSKKPRLRLEIEEDKNFGFYLFVYSENGNHSIADHLQDSLENVFEEAQKKYGVFPKDWTKLHL